MNSTKNIIDYGAVSSVEINQSKAIQAAIDACWKDGGGEVIVPEGQYLTGDIRLRSNITLHLQRNAQLIGSRDPMDYFNHLKDTCEPLSADRITNAPYVHLSTIHGETEYEDNKKEYRFKRIPASRWNNALIRAIDAKNIAIIGEEGSLISGSNCFDAEGEGGQFILVKLRCNAFCSLQRLGKGYKQLVFRAAGRRFEYSRHLYKNYG